MRPVRLSRARTRNSCSIGSWRSSRSPFSLLSKTMLGLELIAVVTKIRSSHTIGLDKPSPGIAVFHATLAPVSTFQETGRLEFSATPRAPNPRKLGQFSARSSERANTKTAIARMAIRYHTRTVPIANPIWGRRRLEHTCCKIRCSGYLLRQQSRSTRSPHCELRTRVSCRVGKRELEHLSRVELSRKLLRSGCASVI